MRRILRQIFYSLLASRPNKVLHFDYLFLGESDGEEKCPFALKDEFSGYTWITPTAYGTAEHAAETLSSLQRTFPAPIYWVSDQDPHFINKVLSNMASTFNIKYNPTVAYSPWVNGTIERFNRDIIAAFHSLLAELNLPPQD